MCHLKFEKNNVDLDLMRVQAISKSTEVREMKYRSRYEIRFTRINRNDSFTLTQFLSATFSISSQCTIITSDQYKLFFIIEKKSSFKK